MLKVKASLLAAIGRTGRALKKFKRDERGSLTVEFAMIAPVLLMINQFVVAMSMGNYMSSQVGLVGSTISDLISQSATITRDEIDAAMLAGEAMAGAADAPNIGIEAVGVTIDNNGNTIVQWARGKNIGSLPARGSSYPIPASIRSEPGFVIATRAKYDYVPIMGGSITGPIDLEYKYFFVTRNSSGTICANC